MPRLHLSYDPDEDEDEWTVESPYTRETSIGPVVVPAGFKTDLASTPRQVWRLFPPWGRRWSGAAVIHDFFYRTKPSGLERRVADDIFHDLMRADGVHRGDAYKIWKAVRTYGHHAWNRKETV